MDNFKIPNQIIVQLIKSTQQDFPINNILLYIKIFARHKNDYLLGPFVSNENGEILITKLLLENEIQATIESGIMDYDDIEGCSSEVEIHLYSQKEINNLIESRTKVWTELLKGEKKRWASISELIDILKNSNNKFLLINNSNKFIKVKIDATKNDYEFQFNIYKNQNFVSNFFSAIKLFFQNYLHK